MVAYVLAVMDVEDGDKYNADFVSHLSPLVAKRGDKAVALTEDADVGEGRWPKRRNIVLGFPERVSAETLYTGPEYAPLIKLPNEAAIIDSL